MITIRSFFFGLILCCFAAAEEKLNYLILLADDISADAFGCYGSPNPNTSPHIDQLAQEGLKFHNMFVAQATCAPTRAELYTGLLPFSNGVYMNHKSAKPGLQTMPHRLQELARMHPLRAFLTRADNGAVRRHLRI